MHKCMSQILTRCTFSFFCFCFMQCVVELFGLDLSVAYEHAFVYIRQLAIQLRSGMPPHVAVLLRCVTAWRVRMTLSIFGSLLFSCAARWYTPMLQSVAVCCGFPCCSLLQSFAVFGSILQTVAVLLQSFGSLLAFLFRSCFGLVAGLLRCVAAWHMCTT